MKPEGYASKDIREVKGYVTNLDRVDIADNYAIDLRGVRLSTPGFLIQRDYGTKHRYATYPTTNVGSPPNVNVVNGFTLYDPVAAADYEFIVGLDNNNGLHVWVFDGSWVELTRRIDALINGAVADAAVAEH